MDLDVSLLEREAATGAGRARYLRALERSGRLDETLGRLLASRSRIAGSFPRARTDLAAFPVADVAPLEAPFQELWRRSVGDDLDVEVATHPLVVVARVDAKPLRVFDLVRGRCLWQCDPPEEVHVTADEVVTRRENELAGRDVLTGVEQWRAEGAERIACGDGFVATWTGGALTLLEHGRRVWSRTIRAGPIGRVFFAPDRMFAVAGGRLFALDPGTGGIVGTIRGEGFLVDARGILKIGRRRHLALYDLDRNRLWSSGGEGEVGLGPGFVLCRAFTVDRAAGVASRQWEERDPPLAVARTTTYSQREGSLVARGPDGARLWAEPIRGWLRSASPVHRGLVGLTVEGELVCFGPAR